MMTPVAQALAQPTDIQSRVNFSDGNREAHLCAFYEWLPSDLHDAPGICWANSSSRVLGYCVNTVGQSPDKGYVAFAIGTAIGGLGQASLHQYLCRFYHLLCKIRSVCGIRHLSDLSNMAVWEAFAQKTEVTLHRYHEFRAYAALREKHVRFYVEHLPPKDRGSYAPVGGGSHPRRSCSVLQCICREHRIPWISFCSWISGFRTSCDH